MEKLCIYNFVGMARNYARNVLGIDPGKLSGEDQKKLSVSGLHYETAGKISEAKLVRY